MEIFKIALIGIVTIYTLREDYKYLTSTEPKDYVHIIVKALNYSGTIIYLLHEYLYVPVREVIDIVDKVGDDYQYCIINDD